MVNQQTQDAALLIDWENLKFSLQHRSMRPNVSALRDVAERFGRVVVARAYADWTDGWHRPDPTNLYAAGIEPIYVPTRSYWEDDDTERRKNSVDVKLTADCIELCHQHDNIGVFVLVTGDQDFLHVVNALRPHGRRVVIVGVSWTTSPRLAERVDTVIFYDQDVDQPPIQEQTPPPEEPSAAIDDAEWTAAELARSLSLDEDLEPKLADVVRLIRTITAEQRSQGQELPLSGLGNELLRRMRQQDFAMIVKGKLKQIVTTMDSQHLIQVVNRGFVDWIYLPDERIALMETPGEYPSPLSPGGEERFIDLPRGERAEIIAAIQRARLQPGVTFMAFNRVRDAIHDTAVGRRLGGGMHGFVTRMLGDGVLSKGQDQQWFDAPSGRTGIFSTFEVNRSHEKVADCLE